ncbi:MAG: hypothetical protein AABX01_03370 [Candidatus Micrarchaeota archaeon]
MPLELLRKLVEDGAVNGSLVLAIRNHKDPESGMQLSFHSVNKNFAKTLLEGGFRPPTTKGEKDLEAVLGINTYSSAVSPLFVYKNSGAGGGIVLPDMPFKQLMRVLVPQIKRAGLALLPFKVPNWSRAYQLLPKKHGQI